MYPYRIFNLFYLYGLMIAIGIVVAFLVLFYLGKKRNVDESFMDFIFYNGTASIVVGFGAAALFQAFYNYLENPEAGFELGGGITFIGGLIGGVICFLTVYFIFRPRLKGRLVDVLPMLPCAILVGHTFGRIGCLFAGCCHGAPTDAWYGILMHTHEYGYTKVVPTQLFEAIFLFALFAICLILFLKKDFKHNMSVYLIGYGIWRFFIEFLRADDRGQLVAGISPSQFWSILMVVIGIGLIFLMNFLTEKRKQELALAGETPVSAEMPTQTEQGLETVETMETVETDGAELPMQSDLEREKTEDKTEKLEDTEKGL